MHPYSVSSGCPYSILFTTMAAALIKCRRKSKKKKQRRLNTCIWKQLIRFQNRFESRSRSARLLTQSFIDGIFIVTKLLRSPTAHLLMPVLEVLCKFEFLRISYRRQQQLDRTQQHVVTHIKYLCVCKTIPLLTYANRDIRSARINWVFIVMCLSIAFSVFV